MENVALQEHSIVKMNSIILLIEIVNLIDLINVSLVQETLDVYKKFQKFVKLFIVNLLINKNLLMKQIS